MYCNQCGKQSQDDAIHCAYCGRVVIGAPVKRPLERARAGRKVAGVCLGVARHFHWDPTIVRVVWLLAVVLTVPVAIIAYFVAWIVMPEEPHPLPAAVPPPGAVPNGCR